MAESIEAIVVLAHFIGLLLFGVSLFIITEIEDIGRWP